MVKTMLPCEVMGGGLYVPVEATLAPLYYSQRGRVSDAITEGD